MVLAIVGSRGFNDYEYLERNISAFNFIGEVTKIISGGARGADSLGERYANEKGIPIEIIRPDWDRYGKKAGFLRNSDIVAKADVIVAFWDGTSFGTEDTINKGRKLNKLVYTFHYNEEVDL